MLIEKKKKQWNIGQCDDDLVETLCKECNIDLFLAKLLVARKIDTPQKAISFLNKETDGFHDPFLLKDMDKAVYRIKKAIQDGEKITIYGDYDVDGLTSVSVLYLYLKSVGATVDYYVPDRLLEGYGLNVEAMSKIKDGGTTLVITVDSGITANDEIEYLKEHGIDTVITDHHSCSCDIPKSYAAVNPHRQDCTYPFKELAGVGVVFKLICAIEGQENLKLLLKQYSGLVAIGTIADVMPLADENRLIADIGLYYLKHYPSVGIDCLLENILAEKTSEKAKRINSSLIGFGVAPRINAAGRIGNTDCAAKLLMCDNKQQASHYAKLLCEMNVRRQQIENEIFEAAVLKIEQQFDFENSRVIVLDGQGWHIGVIGIVASKIVEKYNLPTVLLSFDGDVAKGSARSVKGFNIVQAFENAKQHLLKYGGHELAAGLSIERSQLDAFKKSINDYALKIFPDGAPRLCVEADFEIGGEFLNLKCAMEAEKLEPFGVANPTPVFYLRQAYVCESTALSEGKHVRCVLEKDGVKINCVCFNVKTVDFTFSENIFVDCLVNLSVNDYRGKRTAQLIIKEIDYSDKTKTYIDKQKEIYHKALKGINYELIFPNLSICKEIFIYIKYLNKIFGQRLSEFNVLSACYAISDKTGVEIPPSTFNLALDAMCDKNILKIQRADDFLNMSIEVLPTRGKVNLMDSVILSRIGKAEHNG